MIVPCECGARLKIDDAKIRDQRVKVRCPRCGNILAMQKKTEVPRRAAAPKIAPAAGMDRPLILVADDSEAVRESICSVLTDSGYRVDTAADGLEALRKATESKPEAMVLGVGLPGLYGFELCERLKGSGDTSSIKIVLLSSVYDMRRYKRTPVSLYGADDYIEKHHISDFLPAKLHKLLFSSSEAPSSPQTARTSGSTLPDMSKPPAREFQPSLLRPEHMALVEEPVRKSSALRDADARHEHVSHEGGPLIPDSFSLEASIFQKEEYEIPRVDAADPAAVEKARRFARIIVSDIALYNQEAVEEGLKNGTFYDLLKADVNEGRELYEKRVPSAIRAKKDYYQEAFDNFINAQEKNVR